MDLQDMIERSDITVSNAVANAVSTETPQDHTYTSPVSASGSSVGISDGHKLIDYDGFKGLSLETYKVPDDAVLAGLQLAGYDGMVSIRQLSPVAAAGVLAGLDYTGVARRAHGVGPGIRASGTGVGVRADNRVREPIDVLAGLQLAGYDGVAGMSGSSVGEAMPGIRCEGIPHPGFEDLMRDFYESEEWERMKKDDDAGAPASDEGVRERQLSSIPAVPYHASIDRL